MEIQKKFTFQEFKDALIKLACDDKLPMDLTELEEHHLAIDVPKKSLEQLLEEWSVLSPGMWDNDNSKILGDWFAVCNDFGIVAYFGDGDDAFRFRMSEINRILNG